MTSEAITRHSREARGERGIHAKRETSEKRDARGGKKTIIFGNTLVKPLTEISDAFDDNFVTHLT